MTQPVTADIPHRLGREEARRRIEGGVDRIAAYVPGGSVGEQHWEGDTLFFTVAAMGQKLGCRLEVLEDKVVATFDLPAFLAPFGDAIRKRLAKSGPKLLE